MSSPQPASAAAARPTPNEFVDYREYLRAMIAYLKATDAKFSYRYFSRRAGFSSPNFLKLVADGKRNLSQDSIQKFAHAFNLSAREHEGFETLVLLGQARSASERDRYYARLESWASSSPAAGRLEKEQWQVYSEWFALPIREMMLQPDFHEDPAWIAARLRPSISPQQAALALKHLESVGLVTRDDGGTLRPTESKLSTPPTLRSMAARRYHREMLRLAADALDDVPIRRRNITSLTVNLSAEQYDVVCQRIEKFREELLNLIDDAPPSDSPRDVYALGFQAVPLTRPEQ